MKKSLLRQNLQLHTVGGRKRLTSLFSIAVLLLSLLPLVQVHAASGDLDATFGNGGIVFTDTTGVPNVQTDIDGAKATAIQSDGKIVAAGYARDAAGVGQYTVVRYDANGALDPYFGNGGIARVPVTGNAYSMALQPDGKIVVAGYSGTAYSVFTAVRFTTDGQLDPAFANNGIVTIDFGQSATAWTVAVQSNLKIILAGNTEGPGNQCALARLNENGSLDTSFGTGGKKTVALVKPNQGGTIRTLAIQGDGKIVAGGWGNSDLALMRFLPNGQLDTTFGSSGKTLTNFLTNSTDQCFDIAIDSLGRIIAAGRVTQSVNKSSYQYFVVARYSANGTLDTSFGTNGLTTTSFVGGTTLAKALVLQADNKIVLVGQVGVGPWDIAVARYQENGAIDTSFGVNGKVTTNLAGGSDIAGGAAIQQVYEGTQLVERLIVAGASAANGGYNFAVARYLL